MRIKRLLCVHTHNMGIIQGIYTEGTSSAIPEYNNVHYIRGSILMYIHDVSHRAEKSCSLPSAVFYIGKKAMADCVQN